jgi:hypothetical protein
MSVLDIDDREPAHPQRDPRSLIRTTVVGAPMRHHIGHVHEHAGINHLARVASELHNPAYSTHQKSPRG